MKKELEALNRIEHALCRGIQSINTLPLLLSDCNDLKNYLTPPTADEVCEALSEYLERNVKMDRDNTFYYTEQRQIGECDEIICGYGWENEHHTIAFEIDLPPHLITLIGRFYEGLEESKK